MSTPEQSYPRLAAATQRFTLGVPAGVHVSPGGDRVLYVRSRSGTGRTGLLWCFDVPRRQERLLVDPAVLAGGSEDVPAEERARRERLRQGGAGVTGFAVDATADRAVVALSGRVFVVAVAAGAVTEVAVPAAAVDPRLSPDGRWVAVHAGGGLHVAPTDGSAPSQPLVEPEDGTVTWGLSDFAHAEELGRLRSFWWAPDSTGLLVTRVDEAPVARWHLCDPANPERPPTAVRYPAAGTDNVVTTLWHLRLDGGRTQVPWDQTSLGYLVDVSWQREHPALVTVLSRDQRRAEVLGWEPGRPPTVLRQVTDTSWVDVVPGVPAWWGQRLLTVEVDGERDAHRLYVDGTPATPEDVQVRAVLAVEDDAVLVQGVADERERRVCRLDRDGGWTWLTQEGAVATGAAAGGTTVLRRDRDDSCTPSLMVHRDGAGVPLPVHMAEPPWVPRPRYLARRDASDPRVAVLEPDAEGPWPVLLDPYGGPHGQRVLASARSYLDARWWAEQGYLVVVADGPGTPGRPSWERSMSGRFAEPALAAQVRALQMVADAYGEQADLARVGVRGWSFGGYLAALLVMERPDLVHAAVAGAPVTEWRLYDTAYTERHLGLPGDNPDRYDRESLLPRAARLTRPLLLVHGIADDNVVAAHTLRLSRALLEAGRLHQVLPLSGVTHMTPQEVVAENLLLLQRDFLAGALGAAGRQGGPSEIWPNA